MRLKRLGESWILDLIESRASRTKNPALLKGPGDDCALVKTAGGVLAVTTDELAENTHFIEPGKYPAELAGKLVRMNVSDLSAMGDVRPLFAVAGAALPASTRERWVKTFIDALFSECEAFGMPLAGGNIARSDNVHLYMTATGTLRSRAILRSGAGPGELIYVLGEPGCARAYAECLLAGETGKFPALKKYFWSPPVYLEESRLLARQNLATAMIDNSDGLYKSVSLLAAQSGLGAECSAGGLACPAPLLKYCAANNKDWKQYAVAGGEDFGLVFTVRPRDEARLIKLLPGAFCAGRMRRGAGTVFKGYKKGGEFEHFV